MADTLYIVDGSAYIYRAFFAIRNLTNSQGFPTNAVFGFTNMLRKLLEQEDPEYIAVTFDKFESSTPSFRKEIYTDYKATRSSMPEELQVQLPYFRRVVDAMNIPVIERAGVEADDVIATLTRKARAQDLAVCIVSADKDLMQLLEDEHVRMIDTMRDKVYTPDEVMERFGVPPSKQKYVMALSGDTSDNIPGVPGIGDKTGGKLIAEFGDLETLLANIDKVSGKKRKENLTEFADQARMSLELVTLRDDCDVELDLEALELCPPDVDALTELMTELEFGKPLRDIQAWMRKRGWVDGSGLPRAKAKRAGGPAEKDYRMVLTEAELDEVVGLCREAEHIAFDLETTSLDPLEAEIVGFALAWAPHEACYIPVGHRDLGAPKQLGVDLVLARLKPLLEDEGLGKLGQHVKYEWIILQRYGVDFRGIEWDTMLMSYLLDPGKTSHSLDTIARDFLRHETIKFEDVAGKGKKQVTFDLVDVERATEYASEDADITLLAAEHMAGLVEEAGLRKIHDDIEIPLTFVLGEMERTGIRVDTGILGQLSKEFEAEIHELEAEISAIAGREVNPNSPIQLREVLFDELGLPVKKRTRTGPSTDQYVLEQLSELHPLPRLILEYRSFTKLKGTYVDSLPELIRPDTGRLHTDFNQAVTATGRLSSSNPNLQNIPIRTDRGREIRRAFVPENGWRLIAADYSQIELRLMAHMSKDPTLVDAFLTDQDVHRLTASQLFDVALDEVTNDQRQIAKTINFGVMYGMGSGMLSRSLSIPRKQAQQYIDDYFERYSGVRDFFDTLIQDASQKGFAETLLGRRRILEEIGGYGRQRAFAERVAQNMPIQGTAADIIKMAMIDLQHAIDDGELPLRMLLQVHDELVFECPPDFVDDARELVREKMESVMVLHVPLKVDIGVGDNWLDAK